MITPFMKIFKISVLNILSREFYDVNLSNKYEMPPSTNVPWFILLVKFAYQDHKRVEK